MDPSVQEVGSLPPATRYNTAEVIPSSPFTRLVWLAIVQPVGAVIVVPAETTHETVASSRSPLMTPDGLLIV
jgi:hypothetical protein